MNRPNTPTQGLDVLVLCFGRSFHPNQIAPGDRPKEVSTFPLLHLQTSSRHSSYPLSIPFHQVISRGVIFLGLLSDFFRVFGRFPRDPLHFGFEIVDRNVCDQTNFPKSRLNLPSTRTRSHPRSNCLLLQSFIRGYCRASGTPSRSGSGKAKGLTTGSL